MFHCVTNGPMTRGRPLLIAANKRWPWHLSYFLQRGGPWQTTGIHAGVYPDCPMRLSAISFTAELAAIRPSEKKASCRFSISSGS